MANPDWAINLLDRTDSVYEFLKRNGLSSASISNLGERFRKGFGTPLEPVPQDELYRSLGHCMVSNFIDGCTIGGGISLIVSILPPILKGHFRRSLSNVVTLGNLRVVLFFGILLSSLNTGQYVQNKSGGKWSRKRIRMASGFLSGLLAMSVLPKAIRRFILYLLLTRSFEMGVRIVKHKLREQRMNASTCSESSSFTAITDETTIKDDLELISSHEVVGLGCASMTVIITGWILYPHLVPKQYLSFLYSINNLTHDNVRAINAVCHDTFNPVTEPHLLAIRNGGRICRCIHDDDQPCFDFFIKFLMKGVVTRGVPFYTKLYLLPLVISVIRRKGKVSESLIEHFVTRVFWSSLFIGTMSASVAGTACFVSKHLNSVVPQIVQVPLGGTMCGLSLYIEQESRRLELVLYLFAQAIQILVNAYIHRGLWAPRGMDIIASAASISIVYYAYWERAENGKLSVLRPGYATLLSKIFNTKDCKHGFQLLANK